MSHYAGKYGNFKSAATVVAGTKEWGLTIAAEALETTGFDSAGHKEFIPGLDEWSGTATLTWDSAQDISINPPNLSPGESVIAVNLSVAIQLWLNQVGNKFFAGNAIYTEVGPEVAVGDVVTCSVSFQGTGVLTWPV